MGCVSSSFLEDESGHLAPVFGHHIVSLTSSTYGLLSTLDTSPPPPPPPPPPSRPKAEIINSWELMAGLDNLTPLKLSNPAKPTTTGKQDAHRALRFHPLESFENRCPPGGDQSVVLYTTTLRTIRKTFEDCNAVRAAFEELGVWVLERDVSMHLGFRDELRRLMAGPVALPRVFVSGRYLGGAEEVLRMSDEGALGVIVERLPKVRDSGVCDGCGGARFLPCFRCSGSRKVVVLTGGGGKGSGAERRKGKTVRCPDCNENGLMFCPICS